MVYSSKFVLCILVDGQVQRELKNGTVKLPFGTEYAIRLRNKNKRRAVVKLYVDGENVSGNGYVIPANDYIDIARHHDRDRAFKFVDLDSPEAVDAGKNGPNWDKEKGTIEARFYLEKEYRAPEYVMPVIPVVPHPMPRPKPWRWPDPFGPTWVSHQDDFDTVPCSIDSGGTPVGNNSGNTQTFGFCSLQSLSSATPSSAGASSKSLRSSSRKRSRELEDGCTVEGNTTGQRFGTTYIDTEEEYVSCRVFLQGYQSNKPVYQNQSADTEVKYCESCGAKKTKKSAKFCFNCGAKL